MVRYPDRWEKFGYDPAGNRKSRITGEVEENYIYDVRNRLIQVIRTAGNGTSLLAEGILARTAEDGYGTVKAEEEVWRYEYDRQGNLLKDNYAKYSYDGFNRMEKAETFRGKIQVNHYDAEGLRHEIEENGRLVSFIFSDREVVAERKKESTIRYIRGYDILCSDSECARTYYHYVCDEDGSTSHVLDETGEVLNQYEYDAFGNLIKVQEEVSNRFLYVGQQYDGVTMQYYLRARYTQEDIYRGDRLNLYVYCQNNPVGYYDPSGYSTCGDSKKGKSKSDKTRGNSPQNLSPEGAGRNGAYRAAKRKNNIPMSEQPKVKPNVDKRGKRQPGKIYEFENGVEIRDDAKGHKFPDDPTQDRGPHFNDPSGNHFDY